MLSQHRLDQHARQLTLCKGEPEEAAWAYFGESFCNHKDYSCEAPGCSHAPREVEGSTAGPDGRIENRWTEEEHFAGPECVNLTGYSSWDVTVEEMKVSSIGKWLMFSSLTITLFCRRGCGCNVSAAS